MRENALGRERRTRRGGSARVGASVRGALVQAHLVAVEALEDGRGATLGAKDRVVAVLLLLRRVARDGEGVAHDLASRRGVRVAPAVVSPRAVAEYESLLSRSAGSHRALHHNPHAEGLTGLEQRHPEAQTGVEILDRLDHLDRLDRLDGLDGLDGLVGLARFASLAGVVCLVNSPWSLNVWVRFGWGNKFLAAS